MSETLQFIIVVGFGALCFSCGFLTSLIDTRKQWRDEMIKRGMAEVQLADGCLGNDQAQRYSLQPADGRLGMGAAKRASLGANRGKHRQAADARQPLPAAVVR